MFDKAVLRLPGAGRAFAILLASALLKAALTVGQALGLASAVVNLWGGAPVADQLGWVVLFFACFLGRQLVKSARDRMLDAFAAARAAELRDDLLRVTFTAGPCLVQEQGTGSVTTTLIEGVDQVESYIALILPKLADLAVVPLCLLAALFALDWVSGVIALVVFPCIILFMVILGSLAKDQAARQHDEYQLLSNHFVDSLRGIDTLKLFGRAHAHGSQIFEVSERFRKATVRTLRTATLSSAVLDLFTTLSLAAICMMMGFRLVDGSLAFFPALMALILAPEYFRPIREFASDFHASLDGKNALAAITALIERGAAASAQIEGGATGDGSGEPASPGAPATIPTWGADTTLELEDVGFSYQERTGPVAQEGSDTSPDEEVEFVYDDDPAAPEVEARAAQRWGASAPASASVPARSRGDARADVPGTPANPASAPDGPSPAFAPAAPDAPARPALAGVSLRVRGFAKVGVVGMSGSGKSTLVSLLGGFSAPTTGVFRAGGVGCASLHRPDWQRQVTYIPQAPYVFHATLRDNVAFYRPDASDEQVMRAVEVAGLAQVVRELPRGLDTLVGEGARTLSGGQAQRIALARAFLDDTRHILLFDEPTAHLDIETEMELKERMLPLMEGRLVVFATHRLHWMRDMDLVAVLEGGRLAQVGTPDELLASTTGPYARLAAQLRGDL